MSCWFWTSFFLSSFSLSLFVFCGFFFPFFFKGSPLLAHKNFFFFSSSSSRRDVFFCVCFLQQERGRRQTLFPKTWVGGYSSSSLLSPTSTPRTTTRKRRVGKSGLERRPRKELALDDEKNMTRKEKIFALAKGFRGRAKNCFRVANQRVEKALQYAYRDRRTKKREARKEWIVRINAASREHGVKYAEFIRGIGVDNVCLDRKILAELAVNEPKSFRALCERVKKMRAAPEPLPKIEVREEEC